MTRCLPGQCETCDGRRHDPRGTSQCGVYTLIQRVSDHRVFRFFTHDGRILIPDGYEEFFTDEPITYSIMTRM